MIQARLRLRLREKSMPSIKSKLYSLVYTGIYMLKQNASSQEDKEGEGKFKKEKGNSRRRRKIEKEEETRQDLRSCRQPKIRDTLVVSSTVLFNMK